MTKMDWNSTHGAFFSQVPILLGIFPWDIFIRARDGTSAAATDGPIIQAAAANLMAAA
jgi:hypothetical protein